MDKQELSPEDYKALSRLKDNKDFTRFRTIMNAFQIQRSYNLISGAEAKDGGSYKELDSYRGGYLLWKKATDLVDNAEETLQNLETNEKENG